MSLLLAQEAGGLGGTAIILIVIGVIVAILVFLAIGTYNKLVQLRNRYKNAYSQIDVQLKRRYDLIPNLVETVKGYMSHERETLEAVIQARNAAVSASNQVAANPGDPDSMKRLGAAEADLGSVSASTGVLGRLFALSEAYPDLKANTNMLSLQEELTSTENKVAFSRQAYNDAVMSYNTAREVFPAVIFAGMFGFGPAQFFEIESPKEREAPRVSFS
ncbi:LemA family protein [Tautonia marina]|uniref:LemA family protein n=1 Tax=Tautonia marina TaxID=2653855 RepID=UPI00126116F1|nr:LemA family protein [Tautonia marina]